LHIKLATAVENYTKKKVSYCKQIAHQHRVTKHLAKVRGMVLDPVKVFLLSSLI